MYEEFSLSKTSASMSKYYMHYLIQWWLWQKLIQSTIHWSIFGVPEAWYWGNISSNTTKDETRDNLFYGLWVVPKDLKGDKVFFILERWKGWERKETKLIPHCHPRICPCRMTKIWHPQGGFKTSSVSLTINSGSTLCNLIWVNLTVHVLQEMVIIHKAIGELQMCEWITLEAKSSLYLVHYVNRPQIKMLQTWRKYKIKAGTSGNITDSFTSCNYRPAFTTLLIKHSHLTSASRHHEFWKR